MKRNMTIILVVLYLAINCGCHNKFNNPVDPDVSANWVPILNSPEDNFVAIPGPLTFKWKLVSDAEEYWLQVDNNPDFTSPLISTDGITNTYFIADEITEENYNWRVRAKSSKGVWGGWSKPRKFSLSYLLISPVNGTILVTNQPTFSWHAASQAQKYWFQLSSDSAFINLIISDSSVNNSNYTPAIAINDGGIYWRVRVKQLDGSWSKWSVPWWCFVWVNNGPVMLTNPYDGFQEWTSQTINLNWAPITYANGYYIQVDDNSDFSSPIIGLKLGPTFTYSYTNSARGLLYWRVCACIDSTMGPWSASRTFESLPYIVGSYAITSGYLTELDIVGNYAYVAAIEAGLNVIDVSNPASPTLAGNYSGTYPFGVVCKDGRAYTSNWPLLDILDISNPSLPTRIGYCDSTGHGRNVAVSGNYAYVAANDNGMIIIDISNPANPYQVGQYKGATTWVRDIGVQGNYVFITDDTQGIVVVDVSNPSSPSLAGPSLSITGANKIALSGSYAFVSTWGGDGSVKVVNISDPLNISLLNSISSQGGSIGLAIYNSYLLFGGEAIVGFKLADISNPGSPINICNYIFPENGYIQSIATNGNYAYLGVTPTTGNPGGFQGLYVLKLKPLTKR